MRLDKWLKVSRVIKRRTIANEACDKEKIKVNNKIARASTEVKVGDIIEIAMGNRQSSLEVLNVPERSNVTIQGAKDCYKMLSDSKVDIEDLFSKEFSED